MIFRITFLTNKNIKLFENFHNKIGLYIYKKKYIFNTQKPNKFSILNYNLFEWWEKWPK